MATTSEDDDEGASGVSITSQCDNTDDEEQADDHNSNSTKHSPQFAITDLEPIISSGSPTDIAAVTTFALSQGVELDMLKAAAKKLGFVIVAGTRSKTSLSRIGFNIKKKIRDSINTSESKTKVPHCLFVFNQHMGGQFHAGVLNNENLALYQSLANGITDVMVDSSDVARSRNSKKYWRQDDVNVLLSCRCQDCPPTFRSIAAELNRNQQRRRGRDRPFTVQDCINKWQILFPSVLDANRTVQFLRDLKRVGDIVASIVDCIIERQ